MAINNVSSIKDNQRVNEIRAAIEHRATWFYLLLDEARQRGLDWDDFARKAITRCGCFHGEVKFSHEGGLKQFANELANELNKQLFEMEVVEVSDERAVIEFHYCPLVSAWLKFTDDEKEIDHLCDIAMDGDRGITSTFPGMELDLQETIASGGKVCRLVFTMKK